MAETSKTEFAGVRAEAQEEWKGYVEDKISTEGDLRIPALEALGLVSAMIKGLHTGITPSEAISLIPAGTDFKIMPLVIQSVVAFSVRGDEFRLWWNEWHDRNGEGTFNPWQVNVLGRIARLQGGFDPLVPLTKSPQYAESVKLLVQQIKAARSASQ